jgi:hypothetical protein
MDVYLRNLISPSYYVCLIHPTGQLSKRYTLVKLTKDPLQTVVDLNPGHSGPVLYVLKAGCAFRSLPDALRAKQYLAKKKRSFASKHRYLQKLAVRQHLPYYTDELKPPGGSRAFLEKYANTNYVNTYDRLIKK